MNSLFLLNSKRSEIRRLMSKRHSNRNKELDSQVITLLLNKGVFNQVRANTLANLANEIQSSSFDSMKVYKTIKSDIDHKLASEIVFEYLKRNKMENTIRCIQSETQNKLRPTPISNDVNSNIGISEKENVLHQVVHTYFENSADIFTKYHDSLINDVKKRIQDIGKAKPSPEKPKEKKSQTISYTPSQTSTPTSQAGQLAKTQKQVPAKKDESSSEIDFDLNDDDIPAQKTAPKTTTNAKASTQQPKKQSESSDIVFDDLDDFDNPNTTPKPATKPATNAPAAQTVKAANDSDFSSFNDDDFDDNVQPSPKQDNKSPNQNKPKNEVDDFFDDDQEPPLLTQAKTPPKNDDMALSNDDSLQFSDD